MIASDAKPLTGRKMLWIVVSFFGVIIAVNITMAVFAITTFPGLEVQNSYVASQDFDARARAQRALGWDARVEQATGGVRLVLRDDAGALVTPPSVLAKIGHPTNAAHDHELSFSPDGQGLFALVDLAAGPWRLFVSATAADGTAFSTRLELMVR